MADVYLVYQQMVILNITHFFRISVIPKKPPKISGIPKSHYFELGEWVNLNCSSSPSKPPARLTWFVNGKVVSCSSIKASTIPAIRRCFGSLNISTLYTKGQSGKIQY